MQPPAIVQTKTDLRRSIRERLRTETAAMIAAWSDRLVARLSDREELWAGRGTVAMFGGLRSEPDLLTGYAPWLRSRGWRTVLFAVRGTDLIAYEVVNPDDLIRGNLGVWEPVEASGKAVPLSAVDVILVPGLAFAEKDGGRLGRGGGYYDRLLAREDLAARRIGVAFEVQIVPELPLEAHDACVEEIVTEAAWRRVGE